MEGADNRSTGWKYEGSLSSNMPLPPGLGSDPMLWSRQNVYSWLEWCTDQFSLPQIDQDQFHLNGKALCLLDKVDFRDRAPNCGDVLFNALHKVLLTFNQSSTSPSPVSAAQDTSDSEITWPVRVSDSNSPEESSPAMDRVPTPPAVAIPQNVLRLRNAPYQSPLLNHVLNHGTVDAVTVTPLSQVDTVAEITHDKINVRLLWDFLQQLLNDPGQRYQRCIIWKDRAKGVFKITDPQRLACLWGVQKNHLNMNFDKMSRALRYYYRVKILQKEPGERHCYRFLRHPSELRHCKQRSLLLRDNEHLAALDMSVKEEGTIDPD